MPRTRLPFVYCLLPILPVSGLREALDHAAAVVWMHRRGAEARSGTRSASISASGDGQRCSVKMPLDRAALLLRVRG